METHVARIERLTDRQAKDEIYRLRQLLVDNQARAREQEQTAFGEGWARGQAAYQCFDPQASYRQWKDEEMGASIRASCAAGREP